MVMVELHIDHKIICIVEMMIYMPHLLHLVLTAQLDIVLDQLPMLVLFVQFGCCVAIQMGCLVVFLCVVMWVI